MYPGVIDASDASGFRVKWDDGSAPSVLPAKKIAKLGATAPGAPAPAPAPAPAKPAEKSPSMSDIEAITKACSQAFSLPSQQKKCLATQERALAGPFATSAAKVPAACYKAFSLPTPTQRCLDTMLSSRREPVEVIEYCMRHYNLPTPLHKCMTEWSQK